MKRYAAVVAFQGGAALLGAGSLLWISYSVPPEQYGRYSLWLSVVSCAVAVGLNWSNAALLVYGRREWREHGRIGATLAARLALHLASFVAIAFLLGAARSTIMRLVGPEGASLAWLLPGILLVSLAEIGIYTNQAAGRELAYGVSPFVGKLIFLGGVLLIPALGRNDWAYLALCLVIGSGASLLASCLFFSADALRGFRPSRRALADLLRYSWSVPLGAAAAMTVNWVDAWVIKAYRGYGTVGVYTWAYQVTAIGGMAFASLSMLLTPSMIDAHQVGDRERIREYGRRVLCSLAVTGWIGLLLLPAVYPVLRVILPPAYRPSCVVFLVLMAALPLQLMSFLLNPVTTSLESLVPGFMALGVVSAAVNILGDLLLVPRLGMIGAALATGCVFLVSAAGKALLMKRRGGIAEFPPLSRLLAVCLIMPSGVLILNALDPASGAIACLALAVLLPAAARRAAILSGDDVAWIGRQNLPGLLSPWILGAARWLAGEA